MALPTSSTIESLSRILRDLLACQEEIRAAYPDGGAVNSAAALGRVNDLADEAHALWLRAPWPDEQEFDEIVRLKADIQNLTVECRRALAG
ncbi:hypothetical protein VSR68_40700 [Paraburkholderia phymatum]|uniref:hypothetical protein n=1 Tax=Paraburkholderia phymatum TaxID=148447 RepID=UPI0031812DB7